MKPLFIYSDKWERSKRIAKKLSIELGGGLVSRARYLSRFPLFRGGFPVFLSDHANHQEDARNIPSALRRRKIDQGDLSVVILDEHTDMYNGDRKGWEEAVELQSSVHLGNWVLDLVRQGFSDINLFGVVDFSKSSSVAEGQIYESPGVSYFVGRGFDKEKHAKDIRGVDFRVLEEFLAKFLRRYSFVSLDCDVSQDFCGRPDSQTYNCNNSTSLEEVTKALDHAGRNSSLVGVSVYSTLGTMGMFGSWDQKWPEVKEFIARAIDLQNTLKSPPTT